MTACRRAVAATVGNKTSKRRVVRTLAAPWRGGASAPTPPPPPPPPPWPPSPPPPSPLPPPPPRRGCRSSRDRCGGRWQPRPQRRRHMPPPPALAPPRSARTTRAGPTRPPRGRRNCQRHGDCRRFSWGAKTRARPARAGAAAAIGEGGAGCALQVPLHIDARGTQGAGGVDLGAHIHKQVRQPLRGLKRRHAAAAAAAAAATTVAAAAAAATAARTTESSPSAACGGHGRRARGRPPPPCEKGGVLLLPLALPSSASHPRCL
ncbi:hypothetical protein BU14_0610s0006 [Porphyra umbilicalis]|uniref:Uncharacterized protein n=1 Tax=Porphyra umbilicalis TaxID=2786 RepID=A0A1X6NR83_PORUM|nr:hypothetical protein BU14_0610s0006 [Porphyra umbilicalis]|eukprot:OSX71050.1 hypothetical protein BU14_0610s0006 [Porphyra umbilicalis]